MRRDTLGRRWNGKAHRLRLLASAACILLAACVPAVAQALTNVTFVAFDLETTGFSPSASRIVQIGAVKLKNHRVLEQKEWLVNPGVSIPWFVQNVHGITDKMVKDSPSFEQVYPEFVAFAGDAILLAHNARFDIRFILAETRRSNLHAPKNSVLDTLALARAVYPDAPRHSLQPLLQHLGSRKTKYHRALVDARHVATLFLAALRKTESAKTLEDVTELCGGTLAFEESR
jgi:DNA polymerase III epsilon subunit